MKRHWTPGPWACHEHIIGQGLEGSPIGFWAKFHAANLYTGIEDLATARANAKLASKAPDMAELLIRWIKSDKKYNLVLIGETEKLLKEVGWEDNP